MMKSLLPTGLWDAVVLLGPHTHQLTQCTVKQCRFSWHSASNAEGESTGCPPTAPTRQGGVHWVPSYRTNTPKGREEKGHANHIQWPIL